MPKYFGLAYSGGQYNILLEHGHSTSQIMFSVVNVVTKAFRIRTPGNEVYDLRIELRVGKVQEEVSGKPSVS